GGLTLGGTVLLGSASGNYGLLSFDGGSQALGGGGSVVFGSSVANTLRVGTAGATLIIGPGVLIHGQGGEVGASPYVGRPLNGGCASQGTIKADVGGTLVLNGNGPASAIAASPGGAAESGSTVTITTAAAHGLVAGQAVVVAGVGVAGYNGTFVVTS